MNLIHGDCLKEMKKMPDGSIDAVITDPPYGLSFMGKKWDYEVPSVDVWAECLRVLKPGGYLLALAGTRTQHRMVCAIEDAGFEIRDMIAWVYGQGFPKSLDVSKAIDKAEGAEREVIGRVAGMGKQNPEWNGTAQGRTENSFKPEYDITAPATDAAKQWHGWGTALKPAMEPITVARKPLIGTVAENVLEYGTGALNIDACRVGVENGAGRWPANLIHDGSEEVMTRFPNVESGKPAGVKAGGQLNCYGHFAGGIPVTGFGDSGSAARFFYCAKASKSERGEGNNHPTVKPVALIAYLVKLVCREGGVVLDPFMGSGTTGVACKNLNRNFIGIELDDGYFEIASRRINETRDRLW
jgi:site-specific DNA-methyltransferase (adenine-specific)